MKRTSLISVIIGIACIAIGNGNGNSALAATNVAKATQGNRYLIVVDTSTAMSKLEHGGRQTVFDVIFSGIDGRMRAGDSFGVWTFNDKVSAGVFPIQEWDPDKKLDLASHVGTFLKEQPYGRKPLLDSALATTMSLVRTVKDLNIVVVCSGDARLKDAGPFTSMLELWQEKASVAKQQKKPIIFAFAARGGQVVQRSIALAGEPIELPMPPPILAAPKAPATNVVKVAREPIFMKGSPHPAQPAPVITPVATVPTIETNQSITAPVENPAVTSVVAAVQAADPPKPEAVATPGEQAAPSVEQKKPAPAAAQATASILPQPIPVAAREKSPSATATAPLAREHSYIPIAVAKPPIISPTALILAGGALMAIGLILAIWMFLHTRGRHDLSSITQSMNRAGWTDHQIK